MFRKQFILGFVLILAVFAASALFGQMKIGYVESSRILAELPTAVEAQGKLEEESNKWAQELQKMGEDLRTLQGELEQQSLLLSDAKKKEKQDKIQQLYQESQQFQAQKWGDNGAFFKLREQLLQPIFDEINVAIKKIGNGEGYDYIFDTAAGNILHAKEEHDVTSKILKELGVEASTQK